MSKDYCCYVQERSLTNHKKAWPLLKKALCVYENLSLESLKNLKSREENASLGHEKKMSRPPPNTQLNCFTQDML